MLSHVTDHPEYNIGMNVIQQDMALLAWTLL
jgi:hypothetical protein